MLQKQNDDIEHLQLSIRDKDMEIQRLQGEILRLTEVINRYNSSTCWKLTAPLRWIPDTLRRCRNARRNRQQERAVLRAERNRLFPKKILISICVPLYNTPELFLKAMLDSVKKQTYRSWELCLADGSDAGHAYVGKICRKAARRDARIRYQKLSENKGISENTNACFNMATGDYYALLDHDDLLHFSSLFEVMKAICEQGADFVYTDESVFRHTPEDAFYTHYKPDYAPDNLRANNYICHLNVFRRELMEKAGGGLRSRYDGSQDFDLMLRLTEQAEKIVHIRRVLYYWRAHESSVAGNVDAKPYAVQAARLVVEDALPRQGLEGNVAESPVPAILRIKYKLKDCPKISILISDNGDEEALANCLNTITEKTSYQNYEILVFQSYTGEAASGSAGADPVLDSRARRIPVPESGGFYARCNTAARQATGDYLLFLDSTCEIISPDWLQEMLMYAQRNDVAAVGAKLLNPDDSIQNGGIAIGVKNGVGHLHAGMTSADVGYAGRLMYAQDLSCVSGASMMVARLVWDRLQGFDENFSVSCGDYDFCLRARNAGYLVVWTPWAELYHYTPILFNAATEKDGNTFRSRWREQLEAGDPYCQRNALAEWTSFIS